jgi:hypothetical protein
MVRLQIDVFVRSITVAGANRRCITIDVEKQQQSASSLERLEPLQK